MPVQKEQILKLILNKDTSKSSPLSVMTNAKPMVSDPSYYNTVDSVLNQNKNLNFVQRIRNPVKTIDLGNGQTGTHLMAYDPKSKRAFPTIVERDGKLVKLNEGDEAYNYANKTGEYITFKTSEDAKKFANNGYKIVWNNPNNPFLIKK